MRRSRTRSLLALRVLLILSAVVVAVSLTGVLTATGGMVAGVVVVLLGELALNGRVR
jgi:hypothetical protein